MTAFASAPPFVMSSDPPSIASSSRADSARLRALVEAHIDTTARVLRRLGVSNGEIDDAVQKVFLTLARRLGDVEEGAERAFLYRTALHVAAHARRTLARRREDPPADDAPSEALTAEELVDRRRAAELLERVLDAMPDELREPFVLHEVEELSMAEIAQLLDIPPGTVASRLRRAREEFRERVARWRKGGRP